MNDQPCGLPRAGQHRILLARTIGRFALSLTLPKWVALFRDWAVPATRR